MSTRIVVDCDPGHDDALALLLASRTTEIVGVTTVSGNAPLDAVTANALGVLTVAGVRAPVHAGAHGPLTPPADGVVPHATHVHGASGLDGVTLPSPAVDLSGDDAPEFLLDISRRHADLWLVAIGPLTNVARAIERDPGFAGRLAGISVMGGSTAGGNVTAAAEFNVWADPEAADVVFRSGARIRLCGLNLTHQLRTSAEILARLDAIDSRRARLAAEVIRYLHGRMLELRGESAAALHDPCAVLAVTHPALFEFKRLPVAVELTGTLTRGMTVIDERYTARHAAPQVDVAVSLDAAAAFELLIDALR
ncbi:MAG: nucleoside hydrolase [Pseudomonadales bacterium]